MNVDDLIGQGDSGDVVAALFPVLERYDNGVVVVMDMRSPEMVGRDMENIFDQMADLLSGVSDDYAERGLNLSPWSRRGPDEETT